MAKWTAVVTNKGAELLAAWAGGGTLSISAAAAGTGTVAEAAMIAQTALTNQKQTASIVGSSKISAGLKIQLQIAAPSTGYTLNQFGIWAKVDSGTGVLLALFQNSEGVDIPSSADAPDFVYTFYGIITISNTDSVSVTVDTSSLVTMATMTAAIDTAITTHSHAGYAEIKIFSGKTVAVSKWAADNTYEAFPYAATISCSGVTADYIPEVVFGATEAAGGNFAPVALSGAGTVKIYAAEIPEAAITVQTISCIKAVS